MLTNFKHEEESIHKALGLSDDIKNSAREKVFFCTFSNALVAEELFDDEDDAPAQLTTVTGILEKAISLASEQEYDYMLLTFMSWHDLAAAAYKHYKLTNDTNVNKETKAKMKILEMLHELKNLSDEEEDNHNPERLSPKQILKRIKLVKQSNYNFEKYMQIVNTEE